MLLLRQQTPFQVSRSQPGGIDTEANRNGSAPGCRGVGVLVSRRGGGEWMGYGPIRLDVPCRCLFCPPSFPGSSAQLPFEPSSPASHLGDSRRPSPSARPGPESCKSPASPDQPRPPSSRPPIIRCLCHGASDVCPSPTASIHSLPSLASALAQAPASICPPVATPDHRVSQFPRLP